MCSLLSLFFVMVFWIAILLVGSVRGAFMVLLSPVLVSNHLLGSLHIGVRSHCVEMPSFEA